MPDIKCEEVMCSWRCVDNGLCKAQNVEMRKGGHCATFSYDLSLSTIDLLILDGKFVEAVRIRYYQANEKSLQKAKAYCEKRKAELKLNAGV